MKVRKYSAYIPSLILVAALITIYMVPAYSHDEKLYGGAICGPAWGYNVGDFNYDNGYIYNEKSYNRPAICPLQRDAFEYPMHMFTRVTGYNSEGETQLSLIMRYMWGDSHYRMDKTASGPGDWTVDFDEYFMTYKCYIYIMAILAPNSKIYRFRVKEFDD